MCVFVLWTSCLGVKIHNYYYMWPFAKKMYHGWISTMTSSNEISWNFPPPEMKSWLRPLPNAIFHCWCWRQLARAKSIKHFRFVFWARKTQSGKKTYKWNHHTQIENVIQSYPSRKARQGSQGTPTTFAAMHNLPWSDTSCNWNHW